ncbi:MAG: class I SAM-dependent methyltransferase, partial [Cyanobacteria bacterium K_DeepCast_35m_m2_023]|nr:class I SAM-dependent methyltransferase [Cyanobacteria bacterium K_DeepCast_35m_m2_023]
RRCKNCELVYASSIPTSNSLHSAYEAADFDSRDEASQAASTYFNNLKSLLSQYRGDGARILEIGSGTGCFVRLCDSYLSCKQIDCVEPSLEPRKLSPSDHHYSYFSDLSEINHTEPYDFIFCFMTLEHLSNPATLFEFASRHLATTGYLCTVTHNHSALLNRLLHSKSPIIDIEHLQLFSKTSIRSAFRLSGFEQPVIKTIVNKYTISYWLKLIPLPLLVKRPLIAFIAKTPLATTLFSFNVGNIVSYSKRS